MPQLLSPKKILCIHDLSGAGRCSLAVIVPVLSCLGHQPVCLPTAVLSTHTGGFGAPARMESEVYGAAALEHYARIGLEFDCIFSGYIASPAQARLIQQAFALWPRAYKVVDPAMGDQGKLYGSLSPETVSAMGQLARAADLILPNLTEAHLLLGLPQPAPEQCWTADAAAQLAETLRRICPAVLITGLPADGQLACAGTDGTPFVQLHTHLPRSYPGTGDLFAAVVTGLLLRGSTLANAADRAARFVSACILATDPAADPRQGVWFEPLLGRLIL